jgi:hypothetical protein
VGFSSTSSPKGGEGEDLSWLLSLVGAEEATTGHRSGESRSRGLGSEDPIAGEPG